MNWEHHRMVDIIRNSFRLAKTDILKTSEAVHTINDQIAQLFAENKRLSNEVADMRNKLALYALKESVRKAKEKVQTRSVSVAAPLRRAPKRYIASVDGKKFHELNCVFAKNIKPKKQVKFLSKNKALNSGYKACNCIKKF